MISNPPCIECNSFYHENLASTGCEHYKCFGDLPDNAKPVNEYTWPLNGDSRRHFSDSTDKDPLGACQVECKDGYYPVTTEDGGIICNENIEGLLEVKFIPDP
jgi:hypothetical protein